MWKYNGSNWIWISGSNTTNGYSVYGSKRIPHKDNVPGSRFRFVSWTFALNQFYLFGGDGYTASDTGNSS